jgi:predicted CopG family antitoxin
MEAKMETSTIRISAESHDMLKRLATKEKTSMNAVIERALEIYRRKNFLEETNKAFAALKSNKEAWAEELEERELWESTIGDALEEE